MQSLHDLNRAGVVSRFLIVDDGSGPEFTPVFDAVRRHPDVTLVTHAQNQGKGAALKTGFRHVLAEMPDIRGIVTADADGQHAPTDIMALAKVLREHPDHAVIGARVFDPTTPLRSKFGNELTRGVFRLFTGKAVKDTQTGLRGYPISLCRRLLDSSLTGYEFELEALIIAAREYPVREVPIQTIYIEGNKSSHFNPIKDSARIYSVFFRRMLKPGR